MSAEDLLRDALGPSDEAIAVLSICDAGRVTAYAIHGETKDLAPAGAGPMLELLSAAALRAQSGVFSYRDPDRRARGVVLVEPIESQRVLVGIARGDINVARLRMRRLALQLRLLG